MSVEILIAFIAASWLLAWTPGPTMALIAANTTAHGRKAGALTVLGSSNGLALLVTAAALGMNSLMLFVAEWFDVLRWLGAAYLIWLGAMRLRSAFSGQAAAAAAPSNLAGRARYLQGMVVSLSNPKVLLFLGAFFPQFINPQEPAAMQLAILAATFVIVIVLADLAIVFMVARVRGAMASRRWRLMDGIAGGLLLSGGAALLALRRPV